MAPALLRRGPDDLKASVAKLDGARMPPTRSSIKALAPFAAALCLALTVGYAWFNDHLEQRWQAALAIAERMQTRLDAAPLERPVLWGQPEPGNAWGHYGAAHDALRAVPNAQERWSRVRFAAADRDAVQAIALRDDLTRDAAPALAHLSAGAHARDGRRRIRFLGEQPAAGNLLASRTLAHLAVLEAERCAERGDPIAAARMLLDTLQFARDTQHAPLLVHEKVGLALMAIATKDALFDRGLLDRLTRPALQLMHDGLLLLDEGLAPRSLAYQGEVVMLVRRIARDTGTVLTGPGQAVGAARRQPFATRFTCADHVIAMEPIIERLAERHAPWAHRLPYCCEVERTLARTDNPISTLWGQGLLGGERTRREAIALLRLARTAVAYRLDGSVPALVDPFGTELKTEIDPATETLRVASRAADGRGDARLSIEVRRRALAPR